MTAIHEEDRGPHAPFSLGPSLHVLPLPSATLPPATHTNHVFLGVEEGVLVDPAALDAAAHDRLASWLHAAGRRVTALWLTHHHFDHVGGANEIARRFDVPVLAHPATRTRLEGTVATHGDLLDGDEFDFGGGVIEVLHTPGHARGHLVFRDRLRRVVVAGDLVAGQGTIVIDPPEGDLRDYLGSLGRVLSDGVAALVPAHGPPAMDGEALLLHYIAHRERREAQIVDVLAAHPEGARAIDLVPAVYPEVPAFWAALASRQVLAHLLKLATEGRVSRDDGKTTVPGRPLYFAEPGAVAVDEPRWSVVA